MGSSSLNLVSLPLSTLHLHSCETCEKSPRKNQLTVPCTNCKDIYYKTCPILGNLSYPQFKKLMMNPWDCPPCRKKMTRKYCTVCVQDKNICLIACSKCKNMFHSDCVGNVKLGLIEKDVDSWKCPNCQSWSGISGKEKMKQIQIKLQNPVDVLIAKLQSESGLKILHLNMNSLLEKFAKVKKFLTESEVDVFGICETKLCMSDVDENFQIPNYKFIRRDREQMETRSKIVRGGGLAIYLKKGVYRVKIITEGMEHNVEFLVIKINKTNCGNFCVILVYSPQSNNKDFVKVLQKLIQKAKEKSKEIYIMGDINIDLLNENLGISYRVKNLFVDEHFEPLVVGPTRITKTCAKMIDILFSNCDKRVLVNNSGIVDLKWSDHHLVYGVRKELTKL